eukprot:1177940-Prorocentrum_minimum.AAC.6
MLSTGPRLAPALGICSPLARDWLPRLAWANRLVIPTHEFATNTEPDARCIRGVFLERFCIPLWVPLPRIAGVLGGILPATHSSEPASSSGVVERIPADGRRRIVCGRSLDGRDRGISRTLVKRAMRERLLMACTSTA